MEGSDVYEWRQFVSGERVRIRLSAECPYPHHPQEDGRLGTVAERVDWDVIHAEMVAASGLAGGASVGAPLRSRT